MFDTETTSAPTTRWVMILAVMALLLASVPHSALAQSREVTRISGPNRIDTAVEVSRVHWSSSDWVLVATAGDYPDALAAAALAGLHGAPLLLTPGNTLPDSVAEELIRLNTGNVAILGGAGAISVAVEQQIKQLSTAPAVTRVQGSNRFETAAASAISAGSPAGTAVVASGGDYPDALAAASLTATPARSPILLTLRDAVPQVTIDALHAIDARTVVIAGGTGVVSDQAMAQLESNGIQPRRVSGRNRYSTSVAMATEALAAFSDDPRPLVVATGQQFADALAAGALAAQLAAPLLLVPTGGLTAELDEFIRTNRQRFTGARVIGGTAAVNDVALQQIRDALAGTPPQPDPEPEPDPPSQPGFGDGTHRVPQDVAAGRYRNTDSSDYCYWERLDGFSGEFDDLKANGLSQEIMIVDIDSSDAGFKSERCMRWTTDLSPRTSSPTAGFAGGHYQIGSEIAPGTWRSSPPTDGDHCYWERLAGFTGEFDDLKANGLSEHAETVTIDESDVGFWSSGCGSWTKID